jgi:hypothetical protein
VDANGDNGVIATMFFPNSAYDRGLVTAQRLRVVQGRVESTTE